LDLLRDTWSPAISMVRVFEAILELLANPDPDNALEAVKAELLLADRRHGTREFDRRAMEHTAQFAGASVAALKAQFNISDDA
jgi:ubiquitin-protein ligase